MPRRQSQPLRYQIRAEILDLLREKEYKPGDKLPTEGEFMELLHASRSSLREGFQLLEQDGIIHTQHGLGRYLSIPTTDFQFDISHLQSVTDMMRSYGIEVRTRVVNIREQPANTKEAENLELEIGTPVAWIERIRLAGDTPVIYSIDILPKSKLPGDLQGYQFEGSLLHILEQECDIHIDHSRAIIRAVASNKEIPQGIVQDRDAPWIMMEQVNYDSQACPVIYSRDYHRGDTMAFYITRRRY